MFKNIAVALITPVHTKKSFDVGLALAKKFDSELSIIECVYKIPPKFYFFETKSDKKIMQKQIVKIKEELKDKVVLNLGGIANITILSGDKDIKTIGFDCGPANTLMDVWFQKNNTGEYDKNGEWAANGSIHKKLLATFLADPYFHQQAPKSTGREYP